AQVLELTLDAPSATAQVETYQLSRHRVMGARRWGEDLRFAVWAPNALGVEVVFGGRSGYIADDGWGADESVEPVSLGRDAGGVWTAVLGDFAAHDRRPYMYRVRRDDGEVSYHTDMYSLLQIGSGDVDPRGAHYGGAPEDLDGSPSCSVVV